MSFFSGTSLRRISPDTVASSVLILTGLLFFHDFFFTSKNLYFRDILNFHYPLRRVLIDAYAQGGFPLWNPFIALGQPLLANPNYMAFYPTNLLHLFLPFNYAFKLHFVLHPILGGLGLYFLQRRLGIGAGGAFAGALAYELSGTVLSFLNLYNIVPAVALLPWIAWAFLGALQKRSMKRSLGFGALLALQVLAFEPLMAQCLLLLLAGMAALYILESSGRNAAGGAVARVGLTGGLFAAGAAAVQILPTLELLPLSARGALDYAEAGGWSTHPLDLLNVVIPNLFGHYYTIGFVRSWGEAFHHGREGYLVSFFLGTGVIFLATLAWTHTRRKLVAVLYALAATGSLLSLGRHLPFHEWMFHHIPFFSLGRYPSKFFLLAALALCALAALGMETLTRPADARIHKAQKILCAAAFAAVALAAGLLVFLEIDPSVLEHWIRAGIDPAATVEKDYGWLTAFLRQSLRTSTLFLCLYAALTLAAHRIQPRLLALLLSVLLAAELFPANLRLTPLMEEAGIDQVPEINRYITRHAPGEPFRVTPPSLLQSDAPQPNLKFRTPNESSVWLNLYYRMTGQPMYGIMNGIQYSVDHSVDNLNTRESETLWQTIRRLPQPERLALLRKLNSPWILSLEELPFEGLTPIVSLDTLSGRPIRAYWLERSIQRAYFVSGTEYVPSPEAAAQRLLAPSFPAGLRVILQGQGSGKAGSAGAGSVIVREYEKNRVACEVSAHADGHLVLLDSHYPGWEARVDGRRTEILRANYAFRAVPLAKGRHVVEFRYRPKSFYLGLALSGAFILSGAAAFAHTLAAGWRRRKRRSFKPEKSEHAT